ncbi:MAG: hypothetical protein B7Y36_07325 [Novosphingobium sp. 28-62-57]|uniref:DUF3089 domain-containing protein n=1 Tax=unclassified Novosphingobium TaxID=2644732 RepID=UPI000BC3EADC|nr:MULTISPECIES: DUF3089 domain-containing protein [unclassified Novosphingobium]OYW51021.1 MAG: hypothetical protein B7Z34_01695 [Novosphingobium sp. 12-62-10]OYZ11159.1 MAG: hypothetical protein B7Y36_07325 [Novosphingobium sp. 28-62-57]OZA38604.1 MAG: hypothetical protein B7X92_03780 [Novosphingobium sp. 17-62-9]HQS69133.1 DUF3089 domain-containing protein [Novosphingobium sp.]
MARKFLYMIAVLAVLVIAALFILRIWSTELTRFAFVPRADYAKLDPLPSGAFAGNAMWFSRPGIGKDDPSQWLPAKITKNQGPAAVFFIHPTSYLAREAWNGPLDDPDTNRRASYFLQGMASAFNGQAQVWAPRYRQAAFGAFLTDQPEGQMALDAAYLDVNQAFDAFLAGIPADAPIVLAGHSQGALHLIHLLKDRVAGTPLAARVVAAYPVGWPISVEHDLPAMGLKACTAADQAGCIMTWSSFAEPAEPDLVLEAYRTRPGLDGKPKDTRPVLCTNPLNGGASASAPASANLGTLKPSEDLKSGELIVGAVPARCDPATGILLIGDPPEIGAYVLPGNNYHIYDIPLFWSNLRADVGRRVATWQAAKKPAQTPNK